MSFGPVTVYRASFASAATLSSQIDLGRSWKRVYLDPTGMASEVRFQGAVSSGGTYRQVLLPQPATATVQVNIWKVASAASGSLIEVPAGIRFFKVETTATVDNGGTFNLICSD